VLAAAAGWPFAARAQKAIPIIGYLGASSLGAAAPFLPALRKGLSETGYIEGQNVTIEYRWAEDDYDRLPALAADLVGHKVTVIVAITVTPAQAMKNATSTIPIVFVSGVDPVAAGLVASLARPGGNLTGIAFLTVELVAKRSIC
jgi:putative ABC transport system substrate-binding protein